MTQLHRLTFLFLSCLVSLAALAPADEAATRVPAPDDVLRVARALPDGGGYKWEGSGTCEEIRHDGKVVLPKGAKGTYCCGFTFNVAMNAAREFGLLEGKTFDEIKQFQRNWYGASSDKDIVERQVVPALVNLGIGRGVKPEDAQPGDFLQFWRGKSGHSVVFLGWVTKEGETKPIGFRYRSSQKATDGVGDHEEFFADTGIKKAEVDRNRMYFARFGASESPAAK